MFIALAIIGLYIAGMVMSLFGPVHGAFLGATAFFCTIVYAALVVRVDFVRGRHVSKTTLLFLIYACGITFAICFVIMAFSPGVTDWSKPVFDVQSEYEVCSHGKYTTVTRGYYLLLGTSEVVGWHVGGIFFTLLELYGACVLKYGKRWGETDVRAHYRAIPESRNGVITD